VAAGLGDADPLIDPERVCCGNDPESRALARSLDLGPDLELVGIGIGAKVAGEPAREWWQSFLGRIVPQFVGALEVSLADQRPRLLPPCQSADWGPR
jgi:hypothetical protein